MFIFMNKIISILSSNVVRPMYFENYILISFIVSYKTYDLKLSVGFIVEHFLVSIFII